MRGTDKRAAREARELRRYADMLCLWRVCGNAACRRAKSCRGRAQLCARRNFAVLPSGVRDFFCAFLAAKSVDIPFEVFKGDMESRNATAAFFAWRASARRAAR